MAVSAEQTNVDLRGIDLTTPYDMLKTNRSPFARNFRLYSEEKDDRRVAISSRKGSGMLVQALNQAQNISNANTSTGTAPVGIVTNWQAVKFTPTSTGRLTRLDFRLKTNATSNGAVVIEIRSDNSNAPGKVLADSGILGSKIISTEADVASYFVEAPLLTSGTAYWAVLHIQDDMQDVQSQTYDWATAASGTSMVSNSGGNTWTANAFGLKYKTYITPDVQAKGMARYTPDNGQNKTLVPVGTSMYVVDEVAGTWTAIATGLSASATEYSFAQMDNKIFWVNGFDTLRTWDGTTVATITHAQLPILRLICVHKQVLFGATAADPNKLIYSQAPVDNDGLGNTWYRAYLSTSFGYVPAPHANDPITAIVSFQDTLTIFTNSSKHVVYGSNAADIQPRQSLALKGAASARGVLVTKDFIYFVSDDGFYRYNGTDDELISEFVQSEFNNIADIAKVTVAEWRRTIRFYYPVSGKSYNNNALIFHTTFSEWLLDTDVHVAYALSFKDAQDPKNLLEMSSYTPALYYAEQDYSTLGKAIDFKYHLKYDSWGAPGKRKRINKMYPLLQGVTGDYPVHVKMDKDMNDQPDTINIRLKTTGLKIGTFKVGDGSRLGGTTSFHPVRVKVSGYGYYWQMRIERKGINNPVKFMGYQLSIRSKKL